MKKLLSKIINRMTITIIIVLIQAAWLFSVFIRFIDYTPWITVIFSILSILMALSIITKNNNPAYKILWLMVICLSPLLGGLLYLCFGDKRPARKMRDKLFNSSKNIKPYLKQDADILNEMEPRAAALSKYIADYGAFPIHKNTKTAYYKSGEDAYSDIITELKKAKHFIFIEFFIIAEGKMWSEILCILKQKAKEGVDVRLIYDDMGCLDKIPANLFAILENNGIKCIPFNPVIPFISLVMNHRDHRKIIVIDGHTAFSGGINIGDEYINHIHRYGYWKDTAFMLKGEAVWNYSLMFLSMWKSFYGKKDNPEKFMPYKYHIGRFETDGYIQPFTDSPLDNEPLSENIYMDILYQAESYVYIFTPYMAITNEMQTALINAAKRGVDIKIVTPSVSDNKIVHRLTRSYYGQLIKNGVKIYEYTPGFIHAKSFVSDDKLAVVGTINMDYRSLYLHFECGCLFYKSSITDAVKNDSLSTIAQSKEIKITDCNTSLIGRIFDAVLRFIAPLM